MLGGKPICILDFDTVQLQYSREEKEMEIDRTGNILSFK